MPKLWARLANRGRLDLGWRPYPGKQFEPMYQLDLTWLVLGLAAIQTIYAALTYHRDRAATVQANPPGKATAFRFRPLVLIGFTILTWSAVALDLYARQSMPQISQTGLVQSYGHQPPKAYYMNINSSQLRNHSNESKLMLIVRAVFADVDRMTDQRIEKSTPYTIVGDQRTMALVTSSRMILAANAPNLVEYNAILLPSNISPERITTLADVERVGGKILVTQGQTVIGGPPDEPPTASIPNQPSSK